MNPIPVSWCLGGALAASVLAFGAGWTVQGWRWSAADAERLGAEVKAKDDQLAEQNDIATEYEKTSETARVEYITREGQVREIYREIEVPSNCAAPPAVRSVLEQAVTSANSATGQPGG